MPAGLHLTWPSPAIHLTLNTSVWSSRDTSTSVFGANSWLGEPRAGGEGCDGASSSSSLSASFTGDPVSCGQSPVPVSHVLSSQAGLGQAGQHREPH